MSQEIERKFLVVSNAYKNEAFRHTRIIQGYLSSVPERTVRVRIKGEKGYITVKGSASAGGISRYEWEKEIAVEEAKELLKLCEPGVIDKTRYEVKSGHHTFEVDEFHSDNQGLVVAEVELTAEDENFCKPEWIGQEVTGITKYYNSMLKKNPFTSW